MKPVSMTTFYCCAIRAWDAGLMIGAGFDTRAFRLPAGRFVDQTVVVDARGT